METLIGMGATLVVTGLVYCVLVLLGMFGRWFDRKTGLLPMLFIRPQEHLVETGLGVFFILFLLLCVIAVFYVALHFLTELGSFIQHIYEEI